MSLERTNSKRSREEFATGQNNRPQSPRNSALIYGNPVTPTKSKPSLKKSKLVTSFKSVFSTKPSTYHQSPVSECTTPQSSPFFIDVPSSDEKDNISSFLCTPTSPPSIAPPFYLAPPSSTFRNNLFGNSEVESKFHNLSIGPVEAHQIFTIPEIVTRIISYVDCHTSLPCEDSPVRRRPLSYQHALLIYKDAKKAQKIWNESLNSIALNNGNPESQQYPSKNNLFNCMLVNKLWYQITLEIANTKHFFSNETQWNNFVNYKRCQPQELQRTNSNTKLFIMHKLSHAKQEQVEIISPSISGNLEWIEMYICPKVLPTRSMLLGSMLKKLIIPGSKVVNDKFLKLVSKSCPLLQTLDLRACPLVSDKGLIYVTSRCHELELINVGRHSCSENITDLSLIAIARHCPKISTLGFAGCSITDRGLWEIATSNSDIIQRLSLNNCLLLTNNSLPRIIANGFFQNLSVLEIRHILNLTDLKPLIQFKRTKQRLGHVLLIEGCEVLEYRMREEEWKFDMSNSAKMLNDIQNWINSDDSDVDYGDIYNDMM